MRVLLRTPLSYAVNDEGEERVLHTPMIRVRVDEVETWMILDSGASDHVFTQDLAERIGLSLRDAPTGVDHANESVQTRIGESPFLMRIDDFAIEMRDALVIEGPEIFVRWEIGGFLSPQQLHDQGWAVMDMQQQLLLLLEGQESAIVDSLRRPGLCHQRLERLHRDGDSARHLIVEGRSARTTPLALMINTGGKHVELDPSVMSETVTTDISATGRGLSGAAVMGQVVEAPLTLRLQHLSVEAESYVVRPQGDSFTGQVGMNALTGSILLMRQQARALHWFRTGDRCPDETALRSR